MQSMIFRLMFKILKPVFVVCFVGLVIVAAVTGELPELSLNKPGLAGESKPIGLAAADESSDLEAASLVRVVDGDTLVIDRGNGEEKVRLIGVDTPESVHPDDARNTAEGEEASAHTKELLEGVGTIYLETDTSDTDKYGRLLRYVWLELPGAERESAAEGKMLNAVLVAQGYAQAKDYEPDTRYSDLLHSLEPGSGN